MIKKELNKIKGKEIIEKDIKCSNVSKAKMVPIPNNKTIIAPINSHLKVM